MVGRATWGDIAGAIDGDKDWKFLPESSRIFSHSKRT